MQQFYFKQSSTIKIVLILISLLHSLLLVGQDLPRSKSLAVSVAIAIQPQPADELSVNGTGDDFDQCLNRSSRASVYVNGRKVKINENIWTSKSGNNIWSTPPIGIPIEHLNLPSESGINIAYPMQRPGDFTMTINFGGVEPWEENKTLEISSSGLVNCSRYIPQDIANIHTKQTKFNVSVQQLDSLWLFLVANNYFHLKERYADESTQGGSYISFHVIAKKNLHSVTVENVKVKEVILLIKHLNTIIPSECQINVF